MAVMYITQYELLKQEYGHAYMAGENMDMHTAGENDFGRQIF